MIWRRSLPAKLIGVVLVTTLVALAVALGAMVAYDLRAYHQGWIADLRTQADLLGQTSAPALAFDDPRVARENLALLRLRPQVRAAAIYNARGALFATYSADAAEARFPPVPEADGVHVRRRDLVVFQHIWSGGETLGTVYLRADYELYERVLDYAGIAFAVMLAALAVAFGLAWRLQRIVTQPIQAIATIARETVERRDYSRRAERTSEDEVGTLVESFNGMMAEIERRSQELERRVQERTAQLERSNRELADATDAAEKANRAKSDFISSMSHELRTPLNAILGFGQLLLLDTVPVPPDKRREFTQHIVKAGTHLLTLINEILDLAKIESANLMLSLEPVALEEIMRECETMIEPGARQRSIRLLLPKDTALGVVADRTRLKQVLLNLLSNAIKYNRERGSVMVDCFYTGNDRVRITVRDTGIGLRPEQLAALFQPFNRLGQEAGPQEGSGIGLVVTKRLVELMGGAIGVESTAGVGSAFWIELKSASAAGTAAPDALAGALAAAPGPRSDAQLPLLLYVEDNPANLRLVEEIVRLRGDLRQLSSPDAQLGVELARVHRPQVILMDLNLPGLSGSDAQAVLRGDPATRDIPVIALTANAMARDIVQGMAAGFFRYVTKPIDVAALNAAIDAALAESTERRVEAPPG